MRVREWYGWHFPELSKVVPDNILFARTVKKMGVRTNAAETDFSDFLPSELEKDLKEASIISMGTEVSDEDIDNIRSLCDQVISISEYREQLYDYLKSRMQAIAPNLTIMVGELVGARLIAHAGSLLSLAKHPASTVQILGAEKALFRALKTKHETPKYGLIYHASLIGQAPPKLKGKISRVLAAKTALAARCDSFGEGETAIDIGTENRAKVEMRLRSLEGGQTHRISGTGKSVQKGNQEGYNSKIGTNHQVKTGKEEVYDTQKESTIGKKNKKDVEETNGKKKKKEKGHTEEETENMEVETPKKSKKSKKQKEEPAEETEEQPVAEEETTKTSKKKRKQRTEDDEEEEVETPSKSEKTKKKKKSSD